MIKKNQVQVNADIIERWQNIVDILAELIGVPSALIMRLVDTDIEVFVSSKTQENPYTAGDREHFADSGLYCETVICSNKKLLVPNALKSQKWKNNPDIKLNMISYLGFPILLPDGEPFGTICVLDSKENKYTESYAELILNFREIIQSQLELIYMNTVLGDEKKQLSDYIDEIKILRGIIPICMKCKNIRDDKGFWIKVEKYIEEKSDAQFSHGLCDECYEAMYTHQSWHKEHIKENS